ncbi:1-acyl-sn-glycerol-3-phosphate acyltransferase [Aureibacter tunicatorum]|uniref:1-acyl-sn-glycerol-3-phosphate acyltransferase n=1 Tax=Aureibacter tunicatorum TaxID=866807 RepID=A0AAE4BQR2_9BACT|nr:1-acyl-sn-glycerol-3-phosphate acyltransferase [Aureibacter tunicatorum]MDR6239439.1 1-acyl-sn-glycerol-3-phosphate acyltransferase [Aureibacter tunicatorum]BDD04638.1 acyltransferase [Aureibacter tunicatorum]
MWKSLARFIFWIGGWKIVGDMPKNLKRAVMIAAPHTSNWDFIYARAAFFLMDVPVRFTIKKEWVDSPLGGLMKSLGAIAIDRSPKNKGEQKKSMVDAMADLFDENEELVILITPEGTRGYVEKWRSGFYHIAQKANVPILMGYLDFKKKEAGIGGEIIPSGNYDQDLEKIMGFYKNITAKHPHKGVK